MNWRNGIEKDIDEVLQIPAIFMNATKVNFHITYRYLCFRELRRVIVIY